MSQHKWATSARSHALTPIQGQGEVKSWTIPEIVISLCHDDEPHNAVTTADSNVAGEKESENVESLDDKCLLPPSQHTYSNGQNTKSVLPMEKALTDNHLQVNITPNSVGEKVVITWLIFYNLTVINTFLRTDKQQKNNSKMLYFKTKIIFILHRISQRALHRHMHYSQHKDRVKLTALKRLTVM